MAFGLAGLSIFLAGRPSHKRGKVGCRSSDGSNNGHLREATAFQLEMRRSRAGPMSQEGPMTSGTNRRNNLRKFMLSVLAFVLLAGIGYVVVTMLMR